MKILSHGQFGRVSLAMQGVLLSLLLCGLPLAFSIANLHLPVEQPPEWAVWLPPAWFLGIHQVMVGNHHPFAMRLAWTGLDGVGGAAAAAVLTYLWSHRSHRVRLREGPAAAPQAGGGRWLPAANRPRNG